mmetsp:Transcript_14025/g.27421  ORF Transcript_14025/g.27421 Transcript_14025/m.27421 type:complete len:175 (+) Transcript_14025:231-755(+)|eukprot:6210010-Pleurochrysis_carterae.AAC.5
MALSMELGEQLVPLCYLDNVEGVRNLLLRGAAVNHHNEHFWSPMSAACYSGSARVLQLLLDFGARPNEACKGGITAMHTACKRGQAECVRVLLDAGADPFKQDPSGTSSLMAAVSFGHMDCAQIILTHQASNGYENVDPMFATIRQLVMRSCRAEQAQLCAPSLPPLVPVVTNV